MNKNVKQLPTHLVDSSNVTFWGAFIRKYKLDELLQLFNVIRGEMSLVGPRPNLLDQFELISERERLGVYSVRPGITGLAQISHIDMSNPKKLASVDSQMINKFSVFFYFKIILFTVYGRGFGDNTIT